MGSGAGDEVVRAHQTACRATGRLALMIAQRRLARGELEEAQGELAEAVEIIRKTLSQRVGQVR